MAEAGIFEPVPLTRTNRLADEPIHERGIS
jgi:hypothetical protein